MNRPNANGWQFARVVAVPVAARTCAKNSFDRTWAQIDHRFSSDQAGLRPLAVPPHAESVAVRLGLALGRVLRLLDQRMAGRGDQFLEQDRLAVIGEKAAHSTHSPCLWSGGATMPRRPLTVP